MKAFIGGPVSGRPVESPAPCQVFGDDGQPAVPDPVAPGWCTQAGPTGLVHVYCMRALEGFGTAMCYIGSFSARKTLAGVRIDFDFTAPYWYAKNEYGAVLVETITSSEAETVARTKCRVGDDYEKAGVKIVRGRVSVTEAAEAGT